MGNTSCAWHAAGTHRKRPFVCSICVLLIRLEVRLQVIRLWSRPARGCCRVSHARILQTLLGHIRVAYSSSRA